MEPDTFDSSAARAAHGNGDDDAAAFVLSRFPHPDTAAAAGHAFLDAATARGLSFAGLRRAALSLASALRLGLGLRRGDAVLLLLSREPDDDSLLLLPPIILGVLAAGGVVVVAADVADDATAAEITAVAHGSGAAIVVATPGVAKKVAGVVGVPLLLTSRSMDPRTLSAEELMDDGDPTAMSAPDVAGDRPGPSETAIVVYSSAKEKVVLTHADLVAVVVGATLPDDGRVCLASVPMWGAAVPYGLPLLALGLPAAGVTTVLVSPAANLRQVVAAHGATDVVATPEVAAALAAPVAQEGKLSTLRRMVVVAQAPLAVEARQAFHRRLPWVELTEMSGMPEKGMEPASELVQVAPVELGTLLLVQPEAGRAPAIQRKGEMTDRMSATNEATSLVPPLKNFQKTVLGDIFTKSIAGKILRKHPETCNKQAISKL